MDSNSNNKDDTLKKDDVKEQFIEEVGKFDYIRLSFPDLNGIHLSKLLSTRFARKIANGESEVYSGAITGGPRGEVSISVKFYRNQIQCILELKAN